MGIRRFVLLLLATLALQGIRPGAAPAECPGGGGAAPARPPLLPAAPIDTGTPSLPGEAGRSGRTGGPVRTAASIDARTWEYWWGLNQIEYLPVPGQRARRGEADGYAAGRNPARETAVDLLLAALKDDDELVRTAAARALTVARPRYRAADQVEALTAGLDDPYREVREIAGLALARRGVRAAAEPLHKVLRRPQEHRVTRAFAALALIELGDEKGLQLARKVSQDAKDPDLAGAILIGFGASGDARHAEHLLAALRRKGGSAQRRRRVHCDAMMALGKLGDVRAVPLLARRLTDRERLVQRAAALALGGFAGNAEAAAALQRHGLGARDDLTRAFAVISLVRIGHRPTFAALGRLTLADKDVVKGFALLGLGIARYAGVTPLLARPLETRQRYGEFGAAALAAGLLGADRTEATLARVVGHLRDPRAEGYASLALGLLGAKTRVEHLRKHLWTDSSTLQYGVPVGLSYIDARTTAQWLDRELLATTRDSARGPLVDAVSLMGTDAELQTLTSLYRKSPHLPMDLRRRLLYAFARILTDHVPGYPRTLCTHTYFPFNNDVLAHLLVFP